jgi:hypothetical protein
LYRKYNIWFIKNLTLNSEINYCFRLNSIQKSDFIIVVFILYEVLSIINVLNHQLQSKSATLGKSVNVIKSVILSFNNLRSNDAYCILWNKIKDFCNENDIVLTMLSTGSG